MKRGSFLKSLAALIVGPSIIADIKFEAAPLEPKLVGGGASLYKDLQLIQPDYYRKYVEKYGDKNFQWWLAEYGKHEATTTEFYWFENDGNGLIKCGVEPPKMATIKVSL